MATKFSSIFYPVLTSIVNQICEQISSSPKLISGANKPQG